MMKTTDLRNHHDGVIAGRHDRTRNRRVLVQRQMCAGPFVVRTIQGHQLLQARFVEHDHVIETLATRGSNESLEEGILPRRVWCGEHFLNPHRPPRGVESVERVIAIVDQVSRRLVPWKSLAKLLGRPRRRRMRSDRDVPDASSIMGEEHQDEQESVGCSRDHEEIGRHKVECKQRRAVRVLLTTS